MNTSLTLWRQQSNETFQQNDGAHTPIWDRYGAYTGYWRDKEGGDNSGQWRDREFIKVKTKAHVSDRRDLTLEEMNQARPL